MSKPPAKAAPAKAAAPADGPSVLKVQILNLYVFDSTCLITLVFSFQPIKKYLDQAKKLDKVEPVVAYYCEIC